MGLVLSFKGISGRKPVPLPWKLKPMLKILFRRNNGDQKSLINKWERWRSNKNSNSLSKSWLLFSQMKKSNVFTLKTSWTRSRTPITQVNLKPKKTSLPKRKIRWLRQAKNRLLRKRKRKKFLSTFQSAKEQLLLIKMELLSKYLIPKQLSRKLLWKNQPQFFPDQKRKDYKNCNNKHWLNNVPKFRIWLLRKWTKKSKEIISKLSHQSTSKKWDKLLRF